MKALVESTAALVLRRVWLVFVDHSILGVWRSKREATAAVRLRQRHTVSNVAHFIAGPFVLAPGAKRSRVDPEWIARCPCGATYRSESDWGALSYVGAIDFDTGVVLELRNCVACRSTISRRISLKKGALKRGRR